MDFNAFREDRFYFPTYEAPEILASAEFKRVLISSKKSLNENQIDFQLADETNTQIRRLVDLFVLNTLPEAGLYVFRFGSEISALLIPGSGGGSKRMGIDYELEEADPLSIAAVYFENKWELAAAEDIATEWKLNSWVAIKNKNSFGRIVDVRTSSNGIILELEVGEKRFSEPASQVDPIAIDPRLSKAWFDLKPSGAEDLAAMLAWAKIKNPLTNTFYSFASTRTVFKPYQFLPALKMINSDRGRLLIADEVGLGKTIEAGLVWAELEQRHDLKRVVIVVPAALTLKWQDELERRFLRKVPIWKRDQFNEALEKLKLNPEERFSAIISLESLRTSSRAIDELENNESQIDLVIVDEAHGVRNRSGKGFKLAEALSSVANFMVFMSATPLNLNRNDFFNLVNLLEPELFSDSSVFQEQLAPNNLLRKAVAEFEAGNRSAGKELLEQIPELRYGVSVAKRPGFAELMSIVTSGDHRNPAQIAKARALTKSLSTLANLLNRTRKVDVPNDKAIREPHSIEVNWTPSEQKFYQSVYSHYLAKALESNSPTGFMLQMPLRMTCSSIPVMRAHLEKKGLDRLASIGDGEDFPEMFDTIPEESEGVWSADDFEALNSVDPGPKDSKYEKFKETIDDLIKNQGLKQILVFSFFKGTVEYLVNRLSYDYEVTFLHGEVPLEERESRIKSFRQGKIQILIANQVGSEGLDFQFCNVLFNYDLPWNPMQVEQRIGRLDRFGQQHEKVLIFNMMVPGTIETDIIGRLYERIDIFKESIGDLEPILRDVLEDVNHIVADAKLTDAQKVEKAAAAAIQIENQKRDVELLSEDASLMVTGTVEIEGLPETGPTNGRYVGEFELVSLLERFLNEFGGSVVPSHSQPGVFLVSGNPAIAQKIGGNWDRDGGSILGFSLLAHLRSGEAFPVVFNSNLLHKYEDAYENLELVSARHPLVKAAIASESDVKLLSARFTSIKANSSEVGISGQFMGEISLLSVDGLRPVRELHVIAVDTNTGRRNAEVEENLMGLISKGDILTSTSQEFIPEIRRDAIVEIRDNIISEKRGIYQQENSASLMARRTQDDQILNERIRRQEQLLSEGKGIENIIKARIAKTQADLSTRLAEYERLENISVSMEPVSVFRLELN